MLSQPTKHKKIRYVYNEHISHTWSNNPQVAYTVYTLKNCHEYDPVHEIMVLAKHFTEWLWMNAPENFHIKLNTCIFKVIKPPTVQEPSLQPLEVTQDIQLCHACIYKYLHCYLLYSWCWTACYSSTCHIQSKRTHTHTYIQSVPGGMCQTLGGCSLC